ncbi:4-(cytidine 5'-diphospho)-2-C-methyl-D-erythritol kinase [soil metagenome]
MTEVVEVLAPAKINLWLRILAREESGYHSLETLFCAVSLADTVRISRAPELAFEVEGAIEVGPPERNLCVRAAERFYREMGRTPEVRIELVKRIPSAAGLGGGSSDAAATLRALNTLHGGPMPSDMLLQMGSELGSDVPFFLCGSPLALAWGRGERLLALPPPPPRPVLIAHPGVAMPTADAFRRLAESRGGAHRPVSRSYTLASLTEWERIAELAENDFQPVVEARIPQLTEARALLQEAGAEIALLAGSGASLFGVFRRAAERDAAVRPLRRLGFEVWVADTLAELPAPSGSAD